MNIKKLTVFTPGKEYNYCEGTDNVKTISCVESNESFYYWLVEFEDGATITITAPAMLYNENKTNLPVS